MDMVVSLTTEKDYSWNNYKDGEEYIIMFKDNSIHTAIVTDGKFILNDEDVSTKVIGHTPKERLAFSLGFCGDRITEYKFGG